MQEDLDNIESEAMGHVGYWLVPVFSLLSCRGSIELVAHLFCSVLFSSLLPGPVSSLFSGYVCCSGKAMSPRLLVVVLFLMFSVLGVWVRWDMYDGICTLTVRYVLGRTVTRGQHSSNRVYGRV